MAGKRPLVNSEPVSEFGAAQADDIVGPDGIDKDLLYVPGWSELRQQRDIQEAEYAAGTRRGEDVDALPGHVLWVARTSGAGDAPSSNKQVRAVNDGYQFDLADKVKKVPWLTDLPPGGRVLPTGEIVNAAGDLKLGFASADVARRNKLRFARKTGATIDGVGGDLGDGTGLRAAAQGSTIVPTVERTLGPKMDRVAS